MTALRQLAMCNKTAVKATARNTLNSHYMSLMLTVRIISGLAKEIRYLGKENPEHELYFVLFGRTLKR